jgi:hypothetical protein
MILLVLLLETGIVMNKKQLEKLKNIVTLFMKLETNGPLGNMLILTFGKWHIFIH